MLFLMVSRSKLELRRSAKSVTALMLILFWMSACGSAADTSDAGNSANGSSSPNSVNAVNVGSPVAGSDSNANAIDVSNRRTITEDSNAVSLPGTPGGKNVAKPMSLPAPDDSEYTSQLTDVGLEVRTFKKHPQLLKVEKTITPTEQKVRVFLKDGRVLEVPASKINSMRSDPASVFLAAAGIGHSAPPAASKDRTKQGAKDQ